VMRYVCTAQHNAAKLASVSIKQGPKPHQKIEACNSYVQTSKKMIFDPFHHVSSLAKLYSRWAKGY
jgi:hypothetical protein